MQSKKNDILLVISKLLSPDVTYISHVLAGFFSPTVSQVCVLELRNIFLDSLVQFSGFQEAKLRDFFVLFPLSQAGARRHELKSSGMYDDTEMGSICPGGPQDAAGTSGGLTSLFHEVQTMPLGCGCLEHNCPPASMRGPGGPRGGPGGRHRFTDKVVYTRPCLLDYISFQVCGGNPRSFFMEKEVQIPVYKKVYP